MSRTVPARVVRWPWRAELTDGAEGPRRLLERLVGQTLHHGFPATRKVGIIVMPIARRGWRPTGLARTARPAPGLDHGPFIASVRAAWPRLADASERLPVAPGDLSLLVLERAAGRTTFVLSDDELVAVHKIDSGEGRVVAETEALQAFADHPLVPRFLGEVEGGVVQEALDGQAPVLRSFTSRGVEAERWRPSLASVAAAAFDSLGRASVHPSPDREPLEASAVLRGASAAGLDAAERARVHAAHEAMLRCPVRVRSHGDPSPQNWLVDPDRHVIGLVDLEHTDPHALPGWDVLFSTVSWAEHRGGLRRRGSERAVLDTLTGDGPLARDGRAAARDAILAVGGGQDWADLAPLAVHARRLGDDLEEPGRYLSGREDLIEAVRRLARDR